MSSNQTTARDAINAPWPTNASDSRLQPYAPVNVVDLNAVTTTNYGPDIVHHVFSHVAKWSKGMSFDPADEKASAFARILYRLPKGAVCNVAVCDGETGLHGSSNDLADQRDLLGEVWKKAGDKKDRYILVTAAFFYIHYEHYLRFGYNKDFLGEKHYKQPVGETSLGPEFFPIAEELEYLYKKLELDHGFGHLPELDGNFPEEPVDPAKINTRAGHLTYRAKDTTTGLPIPNPMYEDRKAFDAILNELRERYAMGETVTTLVKELEDFAERGQFPITQGDGSVKVAEHPRTDKSIRSSHSYVGGAQAHGNERNERQLLLKMKDGKTIHIALTFAPGEGGERNGWTYNEAYWMAEAVTEWLGYKLCDVDEETGLSVPRDGRVFNADGGPSVLMVVLGGNDGDAGKPRMANLLAKGGQKTRVEPLEWDTAKNWRVGNAVILTGPADFFAE